MCRRPTNPVLSGRAAKVGLDTKADVRKYPPNKVSSAARAAAPSGCSIDGNGRPYFSNARDEEGEARSPMLLRTRRPSAQARVVTCRFSSLFEQQAKLSTQRGRSVSDGRSFPLFQRSGSGAHHHVPAFKQEMGPSTSMHKMYQPSCSHMCSKNDR